jgi:hypothetical protein
MLMLQGQLRAHLVQVHVGGFVRATGQPLAHLQAVVSYDRKHWARTDTEYDEKSGHLVIKHTAKYVRTHLPLALHRLLLQGTCAVQLCTCCKGPLVHITKQLHTKQRPSVADIADTDGTSLYVQDAMYVAFFAPYSFEMHQDLVARCQLDARVRMQLLGETLDGHDLDLLQIGARQRAEPACNKHKGIRK